MAISSGGIIGEQGPPKHAHLEVMREIRSFAPAATENEWTVDVAFFTGPDLVDSPPVGVSPGPVGRTQRRFVVWHRLPEGLSDPRAVRHWFALSLVETERLVREYLPTKNKNYPAAELGDQISALRATLL